MSRRESMSAWSKQLTRSPLDLRDAPPHFLERFWSKVDIRGADDCWPWLGSTKHSKGYGQFYIRKGVPVTASRVALALQGHVLTTDVKACHRCDNPPCCNPAHIFPGSNTDNILDCIQKGRGNRSHGERHRDARLTEEIVRDIRRNAPYGYGEIPRLARRYGCNPSSIKKVIAGESWRHVKVDVDA
ncbi:uncharacterized protein RMCC_5804 [Mycolicibacterium canariasense]|uniref:HNH nuclease domain-containing protein n=1 Tax=Mycolicibacterium canariasense TaxID=228230 RepID=A0A117IC20_MYCCR|nr:uncharacterized protein RMCC_5804 [Mycolicibacterium canariasense]